MSGTHGTCQSHPQLSCKWSLPLFQVLWVGRDRRLLLFCQRLLMNGSVLHAAGKIHKASCRGRGTIRNQKDDTEEKAIMCPNGMGYPSTFWDRQGARHKFAWILAMSCHAISLRPNSKAMTMTSHSIVTQRFSIFQFRHVQISMFQSLIHSIRRGRGPRTNQTVKENSEPWARPRKEGFRFDDNVALNNQQHRNCSKFIPRYQHGETEERHAEHPGL